jgi:hypothetical protein
MACGLAIILRSSYHYFETPNEWVFMADTLDMLANHHLSRVLVFDGIASTVEYALTGSTDVDEEADDPPELSKEACDLEKVYRHRIDLAQKLKPPGTKNEESKQDNDVNQLTVPDKDVWQNFAVAVYSLCRSPDAEVSKHGTECFQRVILRTAYDEVSEEKWIAIMYLMVSKQPPIAADLSRGNTLTILGQLLIKVLPRLSLNDDHREDLMDLIQQVSGLVHENLRTALRGNSSPLFESTLQTATYLSNHMSSGDWKGEVEFSSWASERILEQLEKAGAKVLKYQQRHGGNAEMTEDSERSELSEF